MVKTGEGNREHGKDGEEWCRVVREEKGAGKVEEEKEAHDRAGHGRAELRVHIGAFSHFYIVFVAQPTPRITCYCCISLWHVILLGTTKKLLLHLTRSNIRVES